MKNKQNKIKIPNNMTNDESKIIAGMIVYDREIQIAEGKHKSLLRRYIKDYPERNI